MHHYNAVCHLNSSSSLSFSFSRQAKSHRQLWIILTFHFHNSPLLLFFLSTGFKSQAGAWERKTVCLNLCIVFSALLSKPQFHASDLFFFVFLCFAMPGILCLEEITATCQRSIKRWEISTLTFSRGLMFQTRMGCLRGERKDRRPGRGGDQKDSGSAECFTTMPQTSGDTAQIKASSSAFSSAFHHQLFSYSRSSARLLFGDSLASRFFCFILYLSNGSTQCKYQNFQHLIWC